MSEKPESENKGPLPDAPYRKQKPADAPAVKIINLLVLAFMAFAVMSYFGRQSEPESSAKDQAAATAQTATEPVDEEGDIRIERLRHQENYNALSRLFPDLRPSVLGEQIKPGEGRRVLCGQKVTFRVFDPKQEKSEKGAVQTLTLGQQSASNQGLVWGIEGMRPGEIRELTIPLALAGEQSLRDAKDGIITRRVELLRYEPELPVPGPMPLKRGIIGGQQGMHLRCGEQAIAHLTLWTGSGKLLFSSLGGLPVYFEIGSGKGVPYGMELGAMEMGPGGEFTLIIPPELVPPLHPGQAPDTPPTLLEVRAMPQDIAYPPGEVLIADMKFVKTPPVKGEASPETETKELPMPEVQ